MELCSTLNITESCEKDSFYDKLQKCIDISKCLKYLHDNNIIHRDLNPSNIVIGNDDLPNIIDFGISSFNMFINDDAIKCSTPLYASPEHKEKENLNPKFDIYSLGIIFLEVLILECRK